MSQGPAPASDVRTLSPAELYALYQELGGQLQRHETTLQQLSVVVFGDERLGVLGLKLQMERQHALLEQIRDGQATLAALLNGSLPSKADKVEVDEKTRRLQEGIDGINRKLNDKKSDQRWTLSYMAQVLLIITSITGMLGTIYQVVTAIVKTASGS